MGMDKKKVFEARQLLKVLKTVKRIEEETHYASIHEEWVMTNDELHAQMAHFAVQERCDLIYEALQEGVRRQALRKYQRKTNNDCFYYTTAQTDTVIKDLTLLVDKYQ
jgi:hypothetical protein